MNVQFAQKRNVCTRVAIGADKILIFSLLSSFESTLPPLKQTDLKPKERFGKHHNPQVNLI